MSASANEGRATLRRSLLIRLASAPLSALLGVLNSALIVTATGAPLFGVITLVATIAQQIPFADLGVGGIVTTAVAHDRLLASGESRARKTVKRAAFVLSLVAASLIVIAAMATLGDFWSAAFSFPLTAQDSWCIFAAISLFAVNVPASLSARIMTGLGKNEFVVLGNAVSSLLIVALTASMVFLGAAGMAFAIPAMAGPLLVNLLFITMLLVRPPQILRCKTNVSRSTDPMRLLSGAGLLLAISVGLPSGLQSGRYIVAQFSPPSDLATYALGMQIYTAAWGILSVASAALWSAFVGLRQDVTGSVSLWRRSTLQMTAIGLLFGGALVCVGPWAVTLISAGEVTASPLLFIGFAVLLMAQSAHLTSGAMLTLPHELRWQAICVAGMASLSILLSTTLVPSLGPSGAALGAGVSVLLCQVVPDILWARVLLKRRVRGIS